MTTARIPSAYASLDSDTFRDGRAYDAQQLDAIAQAANRLTAAPSLMFSSAWPQLNRAFGEAGASIAGLAVWVGPSWTPVTPPFVVRKKPGAETATFKAGVVSLLPELDLRVETRASPWSPTMEKTLFTDDGGGNLTATGVPVDPGPFETIRLWARSNGVGAQATATYGSPVTGGFYARNADVMDCFVIATGAAITTWNSTYTNGPDDYGSRGYLFGVYDPGDNFVAAYRIRSVRDSLMFLTESLPQSIAIRTVGALNNPWIFKLHVPTTAELLYFAGATEART